MQRVELGCSFEVAASVSFLLSGLLDVCGDAT